LNGFDKGLFTILYPDCNLVIVSEMSSNIRTYIGKLKVRFSSKQQKIEHTSCSGNDDASVALHFTIY
jgi:hypothetical protein